MPIARDISRLRFALLGFLVLCPAAAFAGGPRQVAGTTYFNPGLAGTPIHWANGQVKYYVDQGPLSASVSNQQATAMVDAAAALWSGVAHRRRLARGQGLAE